MVEYVQIQLRRDVSVDWTSDNPILSEGEPGFESNTYRLKIGDGTTRWNTLPYMPYRSEVDDMQADIAALQAAGGSGGSSLYSPSNYGAVGDGVTNDLAALQAACNAASAAGGGTVSLLHPTTGENVEWAINGELFVPGMVNLFGGYTGAFVAGGGPTIKCLSNTSRVRFGDGTPTHARGGISQGFRIDGNNTGHPDGIFYSYLSVHRMFMNMSVVNGAGDNMFIRGSQNCMFLHVDTAGALGTGLILDDGAGGLSFVRCESVGNMNQLHVRETAGGIVGTYPFPSHNDFKHCIFECYNDNPGSVVDTVAILAAGSTSFHDCGFASNASTDLTDGRLIFIDGTTASGSVIVTMDTCLIIGTVGETYTGVEMDGIATCVVTGLTLMQFLGNAWKTNNLTSAMYNYGYPIIYTTVTTKVAEGSPGDAINWGVPHDAGHSWTVDPVLHPIMLTGKQSGDAGTRWWIDINGAYKIANGSTFTAIGALQASNADPGLQVTGGLRVANRWARTGTAIAHSVAGAVTLDVATSSHFRYLLTANITGMTINNAIDGTEISITIRQDSTGGRTTVWPTNARFNAGSAPGVTTLNTQNTVYLRYDASLSMWFEMSRAVNIPVV